MKHFSVKCLAQGHNIEIMSQNCEGRNMISEKPARSGIRNRTASSDITKAPRSNNCATSLSIAMRLGISMRQLVLLNHLLQMCYEFFALDMKGCICHFTKWQIHPFRSNRTNYCRSSHINPLNCHDVSKHHDLIF